MGHKINTTTNNSSPSARNPIRRCASPMFVKVGNENYGYYWR